MSAQRTSTCRLEKTGERLTVEVEKLTLNISHEDQQAFLQNPEQFVAELLKANGETVNSLEITSSAIDHLKAVIRKEKGGTTTSTWHCESPKDMASRRIVVTETKKAT